MAKRILEVEMLQAEVGSAKVTEVGVYPSRGHLIGDFTLPSMGGKPVSPYDYRGRSNLVLIFAGDVGQATGPFDSKANLLRRADLRFPWCSNSR